MSKLSRDLPYKRMQLDKVLATREVEQGHERLYIGSEADPQVKYLSVRFMLKIED